MIKRNPKEPLKNFRILSVCLTIFIAFLIMSIYSVITTSTLIGGEISEYIGLGVVSLMVIWVSILAFKRLFIFK